MRPRLAFAGVLLVLAPLSGCAGQPTAIPTIGSPEPVAGVSPSMSSVRSAELARQWKLTGNDLPEDWPDVPLPTGTEVITFPPQSPRVDRRQPDTIGEFEPSGSL